MQERGNISRWNEYKLKEWPGSRRRRHHTPSSWLTFKLAACQTKTSAHGIETSIGGLAMARLKCVIRAPTQTRQICIQLHTWIEYEEEWRE